LHDEGLLQNINLRGDQYEGDELGGACNTHEGDEKCVQNFGRNTSEDEAAWVARCIKYGNINITLQFR